MPLPDGRPRDEVPAEALTRRQQEIVVLITEGLTDQEIADRLGLERGTIAHHVDQIMRRLGMTRRIPVAIWAARQAETLAVSHLAVRPAWAG